MNRHFFNDNGGAHSLGGLSSFFQKKKKKKKKPNLWNELDHNRPHPANSSAREYILWDRKYRSIKGLCPEFELMQSPLFNYEDKIWYDHMVKEENQIKSTAKIAKVESQEYLSNVNMRISVSMGAILSNMHTIKTI